MSTSPTPASNTGSSCHETPQWLYMAPTAETKQRRSLVSRLKIVVSISSSRSTSTSSVAAAEASSNRGSRDWTRSPTSSPLEQPESAAKIILARGSRILRRQGSKFSLGRFILDEETENTNIEISETCQRPQKSRKKSKDLDSEVICVLIPPRVLTSAQESPRMTISAPFDFHHVTHTHSRQFESLDRRSHNELITEFIAIRAAQRPKSTLQGIEANDLRTTSNVNQSDADQRRYSSTAHNSSGSVAQPKSAILAQIKPPSPGCSKSVHPSPSIENFSRPTPKSPTSTPLRMSSRNARDCLPGPDKAMIKSTDTTSGEPAGLDFADKTQSANGSNLDKCDTLGPVPHAITTIDGSARLLKDLALPTPSCDVHSSSAANAHSQPGDGLAPDVATMPTLPLRHACSFPTVKILSQNNHHYFHNRDRDATETGARLSQPQLTGQWEDVVDYCYQHAAEADCNFDWTQKSVYVDAELGAMDAPSPERRYLDELPSSRKQQPVNGAGNRGSVPYFGALSSSRQLVRSETYAQQTVKKSVPGFEDRHVPFGPHQSSREFRGYQHRPQTSPKPFSKVSVGFHDPCFDDDASLLEEACGRGGLELAIERHETLERCSSGGSSSFRGLRLAMSKYSSNGSLLSSTTSTTRTNRSSNSVGSLPELIYSFNNSREDVVVERQWPAETVNRDLRRHRPRLPSASRSLPEVERMTAEHQQSPSTMAPHDAASEDPSTASTSPVKYQDSLHKSASKGEGADSTRAKVGNTSTRKRSASAITPGRHPPTRGSYSLFPPQPSLPRFG